MVNANNALPTPQAGAKWIAIVRGKHTTTPVVTGYIEMWFAKNIGRWVTIPGASRFVEAVR